MDNSLVGVQSMKLAVYSTKNYDRKYFELVNQQYGFEFFFFLQIIRFEQCIDTLEFALKLENSRVLHFI